MIGKYISKLKFSFQVDSAKRYFIVNYIFNENYKKLQNEQMMQKQREYLQGYEDNSFLIFCGKDVNNSGMSMIFHCQDERLPYQFIKQDPYYVQGAVEDYKLEEIELRSPQESKEIATIYKYR